MFYSFFVFGIHGSGRDEGWGTKSRLANCEDGFFLRGEQLQESESKAK